MSSMETYHEGIKPQAKGPQQQQTANSSSSPVPSASSSPAHEFSFTISLHSSTTTNNTPSTKPSSPSSLSSKTKQQPLAIDLTPADEIFFHGHLLPLHFLSHLHATSARPSTHSSDGLALPVPDFLLDEEQPLKHSTTDSIFKSNSITCACEDDYCISFNKDYNYNYDDTTTTNNNNDIIINCSAQERTNNINCTNKSKSSFSLFGLSKWKKGSSEKAEKSEETSNNNNKMRKVKFELSQFLKRYINMVKPLLPGGKREGYRGRRQAYSFSGTVSPRAYSENLRGRRGEFSAPASMRTSPTNSGLLLATAGVPSPVSDSTMEELQAAIQAAIAHCKNSSISVQDNNINSNELQSQELPSIPVN